MNGSEHNHSRNVPERLAALLADESEADSRALAHAWEESGALLRDEPSRVQYDDMGREIWENLEREIRRTGRPPRPARRARVWRWVGATASVLVLAASAFIFLTAETHVLAPAGERLTHVLPDGSTVELNSGASISYAPRTFGWLSRKTTLNGEAFFSVLPHETEFIARTFNAQVRVLGTSFNVRAWPDEAETGTVVTLHTGKVLLSSRAFEARSVVLEPGQMSRVDRLNAVPSQPEATDLAQAAAWRTGRFVFVDTPLRTILAELERRFDVSIRADAADILDDRLTLAYENPAGAEIVLTDIAAWYSRYSFRPISDGYELYVPER